MTVLLVHNRYRFRGGEDRAFEAEGALLEAHGHRVVRYVEDNARIPGMGRVRLAWTAIWNRRAYRQLRELIRRERPSLVHFHNSFPLLSVAALCAARDEGVPAVETLHNYRLACPNGLLWRDGKPCRACLGRAVPWPGVRHGCYRRSRAATLVAALAIAARKAAGAWHDGVEAYIVPSAFARAVLLEAGLPERKLVVKPNFVYPDPGPGDGSGAYAVYLGRLSEEKGVGVLLEAWSRLRGSRRLVLAGGGPLARQVQERSGSGGIEAVGVLDRDGVAALLRGAAILVAPSLCYEVCPMAALEALAAGTPVVASELGGLTELVTPGRTGWLVPPGDAAALAGAIEAALEDPSGLRTMRREARRVYLERYTAEANYRRLVEIYSRVVGRG
ncbi:MAG: glycosyltransferase [Bryobacterales bacterium]|nr:glycosyltransferase [Bryobacteraceae bacterium]MDW8130395.1 glycosyltransferase [Bryobacterales bacterium]